MKTVEQELQTIREEFKEKCVREVSQGAVQVSELYGVQVKQEIIKDIVYTSPEIVMEFYESHINRLLEEQRIQIQKEIDYCNRNQMKKWQKVRQEGYVQGLEFALRKCLDPTTKKKEVSGE